MYSCCIDCNCFFRTYIWTIFQIVVLSLKKINKLESLNRLEWRSYEVILMLLTSLVQLSSIDASIYPNSFYTLFYQLLLLYVFFHDYNVPYLSTNQLSSLHISKSCFLSELVDQGPSKVRLTDWGKKKSPKLVDS